MNPALIKRLVSDSISIKSKSKSQITPFSTHLNDFQRIYIMKFERKH